MEKTSHSHQTSPNQKTGKEAELNGEALEDSSTSSGGKTGAYGYGLLRGACKVLCRGENHHNISCISRVSCGWDVARGGCKSWPKHIKIIKVHQAANKNDSSNNRHWPFDWKTMEKYQGFHGVIFRFARQSVPWSSLQALRLKAKKEDDLEEERQAAEAWPKLLEQWRKTLVGWVW